MSTEQLNLPMPDQEQPQPSLEDQLAALEGNEQVAEEQPPEPERPGWLPEKFKTPEDLAKSYSELERKLSQVSQQTTPEVDNLVTDAEREFMETGGEISDDTIAKFEKVGIPRALVEQIRDMRVREGEAARQAIVSEFGGDQAVSQMQEWAGSGVYEDTMINKLNDMLNSNDQTTVRMAMNQIRSDFQAATGAREPSQTISGRGAAQPQGFRSSAEMVAAMQDPRYRKDPAFRQDVERKVALMQ